MQRLPENNHSRKASDRLSAFLIPTLEVLEAEWRASGDPVRRPLLQKAHEAFGQLLELELGGRLR